MTNLPAKVSDNMKPLSHDGSSTDRYTIFQSVSTMHDWIIKGPCLKIFGAHTAQVLDRSLDWSRLH